MPRVDDDLLDYYRRELTYLRRMGSAFAEQYPKVAGRLEIGPDQSDDPHIERLLESFAFLTARIQRNLESEFPEFTSALLGLLYPQFLAPVPAMSIARFEVDPTQGKLTTGRLIAKNTPLFANTTQGLPCRFRTGYPVTLWPIEVVEAGFVSTDQFDNLDLSNTATVLRLRLRAVGETFESLACDKLRFYIHGDPMLAASMFELLHSQVTRVAMLSGNREPQVIDPARAILPVGFGPDEDVLPYPGHAHAAYRLLQEYFTIPEKYLFFDLAGLDFRKGDEVIDVLFLIDSMPRERLAIGRETFLLGCTPIINLFSKTAEPLRLTHRQSEYRIIPDLRRELTTEIHSIHRVSATVEAEDDSRVFAPFFSFDHAMDGNKQAAFWHARRVFTGRKDLPGTDMLLSFLDRNFNPARPPSQTIFVHTLCTNRLLTEQLPASALLEIEEAAPLQRIVCLKKPSMPRNAPLGGTTAWQLISHLSLNYLSLSEGRHSLTALREILRLYVTGQDAAAEQQIMGIRDMQCRPVVRRLGDKAWRGFVRGMEVTLEVDERQYVGSSAFLLGGVLARFFGLYSSINSFAQLRLVSLQRSGIWKTWPPFAGDSPVL